MPPPSGSVKVGRRRRKPLEPLHPAQVDPDGTEAERSHGHEPSLRLPETAHEQLQSLQRGEAQQEPGERERADHGGVECDRHLADVAEVHEVDDDVEGVRKELTRW